MLLAVKAEVDRERRPGRFLLTGSTRLLGAPKLADSLAGRMEALTLWPFTQAELGDGVAAGFIDRAFDDDLAGLRPSAVTRAEVLDRAGAGGFLPALTRTGRRRSAWFDSYVSGVIDREVRAVTDARDGSRGDVVPRSRRYTSCVTATRVAAAPACRHCSSASCNAPSERAASPRHAPCLA